MEKNNSVTRNIYSFTDESTYFTLKHDEVKNSYSIVLKDGTSIPDDDIKGKSSLTLTLTATLGGKTDKASILLSLPTGTLKFTNTLYTASYNAETKTVLVDTKKPIAFGTQADGVTITIDESKYEFD